MPCNTASCPHAQCKYQQHGTPPTRHDCCISCCPGHCQLLCEDFKEPLTAQQPPHLSGYQYQYPVKTASPTTLVRLK
jgi:hypothetical protein